MGYTGAQAKASGRFLDITETAYPMMGNARMLMSGSAGAMTVVSGEDTDNPGTRVLLGVHMAGPEATELIAEAEQLVGNHVPLSRGGTGSSTRIPRSPRPSARRCSKRTDARCTQDESPPDPAPDARFQCLNARRALVCGADNANAAFTASFSIFLNTGKLLASMPIATSSK